MAKRRTAFLLAGEALLARIAAAWAPRKCRPPSACPYSQCFFPALPRPFMRWGTLLEILTPAPGERVLEVGPGLGYYGLSVGREAAPVGRLPVLALRPAMLEELMRR